MIKLYPPDGYTLTREHTKFTKDSLKRWVVRLNNERIADFADKHNALVFCNQHANPNHVTPYTGLIIDVFRRSGKTLPFEYYRTVTVCQTLKGACEYMENQDKLIGQPNYEYRAAWKTKTRKI